MLFWELGRGEDRVAVLMEMVGGEWGRSGGEPSSKERVRRPTFEFLKQTAVQVRLNWIRYCISSVLPF